jgi:hypothetical protein
MNSTNNNSVYDMMSKGINVVLAKTLLNIECKQNQAIATINDTWDEKMCMMKREYDNKIENQANKIQMLHVEIRQLKELIFGTVAANLRTTEATQYGTNIVLDTTEPANPNVNILALNRTVKETKQKVRELEEMTSSVQDFVENFVKFYEDRNAVVDCVITKHENDLKTSRDAICIVGDKIGLYSKQLALLESKLTQHIDSLPIKLDGCVEESTKSNETYVSVDEHNQLRMNLEHQILACDIKCDHILLAAQQQWEQYKRQCDEVEVVKGVLTRTKNQRKFALANIESRYRILTETIENESKTCDSNDKMIHAEPIMKNSSLHHDDARKVHFQDERENTGYTLHYEFEDNESEFGASVSLMLLDEYSVH